MDGDNYKAYICYAIALSEFKEYNMAEEMYKRAIRLNPDEKNAYVLLANLYTNYNRIDLAMNMYKDALHAKPNDPETYMLLGNAHYLDGDIEKAIASYRSSINIAPENDEYRLVYTQVLDEYAREKFKRHNERIQCKTIYDRTYCCSTKLHHNGFCRLYLAYFRNFYQSAVKTLYAVSYFSVDFYFNRVFFAVLYPGLYLEHLKLYSVYKYARGADYVLL